MVRTKRRRSSSPHWFCVICASLFMVASAQRAHADEPPTLAELESNTGLWSDGEYKQAKACRALVGHPALAELSKRGQRRVRDFAVSAAETSRRQIYALDVLASGPASWSTPIARKLDRLVRRHDTHPAVVAAAARVILTHRAGTQALQTVRALLRKRDQSLTKRAQRGGYEQRRAASNTMEETGRYLSYVLVDLHTVSPERLPHAVASLGESTVTESYYVAVILALPKIGEAKGTAACAFAVPTLHEVLYPLAADPPDAQRFRRLYIPQLERVDEHCDASFYKRAVSHCMDLATKIEKCEALIPDDTIYFGQGQYDPVSNPAPWTGELAECLPSGTNDGSYLSRCAQTVRTHGTPAQAGRYAGAWVHVLGSVHGHAGGGMALQYAAHLPAYMDTVSLGVMTHEWLSETPRFAQILAKRGRRDLLDKALADPRSAGPALAGWFELDQTVAIDRAKTLLADRNSSYRAWTGALWLLGHRAPKEKAIDKATLAAHLRAALRAEKGTDEKAVDHQQRLACALVELGFKDDARGFVEVEKGFARGVGCETERKAIQNRSFY